MSYYAVIFTSTRTNVDEGYEDSSVRLIELAEKQPGFLGVEAARDSNCGITVSYWESEDSIRNWKVNLEHSAARERGRKEWYASYKLRVCKIEREYSFEKE